MNLKLGRGKPYALGRGKPYPYVTAARGAEPCTPPQLPVKRGKEA